VIIRADTTTAKEGVTILDRIWLERFDAASGDVRRAMLEAAVLRQGWGMIVEAADEEVALEWLQTRVKRDSGRCTP
jgi:hypothetical protein